MSIKGKKLLFVVASVFNSFFAYVYILALGYAAGNGYILNGHVVTVSGLIVGLQIGQTLAVQGRVSGNVINQKLSILIGLLVFLVSSLLLDAVWLLLVSFSSALIGYSITIAHIHLLTPSEKWLFQTYVAIRNLIVCVFLTVIVYIGVDPAGLALVGMVILVLYANKNNRVTINVKAGGGRALLVVLLGVVGSSFYRNDANFVRNYYLSNVDFVAVSNLMVVYSVFGALSGFVVTNYIYARHNIGSRVVDDIYSNKNVLILCAISIFSVVVGLMLEIGYWFYLCAIIPAMTNPLMSGGLHCKSHSGFVYASGCGALVLGLALGYIVPSCGPECFFSVYLITLSVLLGGRLIVINRSNRAR